MSNTKCKRSMSGGSPPSASRTICEATVRRALGNRASIARSQSYYLDVTPAGTNKGIPVAALVVITVFAALVSG